MLKQILFSCLLILFVTSLKSQSVGIGTSSPNTKALLELKSTSQGLLLPRMSTAQMNAMGANFSENGMLIYNTSEKKVMYYFAGWNSLGSRWLDDNDGLYTLENIAIGSTPTSNYKFRVNATTQNIAARIENNYSGTSAKYGIQISTGNQNTNSVTYGLQNTMLVNAANTRTIYGTYTSVNPSTSSGTIYGTYSKVVPSGNSTKYAFYGDAIGENNYAAYLKGNTYVEENLGLGVTSPSHKLDIENPAEIGINLNNTSPSADSVIGFKNVMEGNGSGARFGILNRIYLPSNYDNETYGIFSAVQNAGAGNNVGVLGQANGTGNVGVQGNSTGTGTGVKGVNTNFNGWAGFFDGRAYVDRQLNVGDNILIEPTGYNSGAEIEMFDDDGTATIQIRANQSTTNGSEIKMYNDEGDLTIELDGDFTTDGKGRIITGELEITGGSDLAEHFDINSDKVTDIKPGMLVSIDPSSNGKLNLCTEAYDKKVAGVISGANGVKPGMLMGQKASIADGAYPIALTGRVYVMADASRASIKPGDLLCSSSIPGYAMKAKNNRKAKGAVIGKAMTALDAGQGYVLILVNLQ